MTPIVFVHGFMGGSAQWQDQERAFAGRDFIALDLPGFGLNAAHAACQSIREYAQWALNTLSAQGVHDFHLLGHSMGGMIVQEMIALAPERVKRLVLYGTGATGVLPGRFETIETSKERACADGPTATARRIAATWFLEGEDATAYEPCASLAQRSSIQSILAGLNAMNGWSGVHNLSNISQPTLIVWGEQDRTYPWSQTKQLAHMIPNTDLKTIPECAHAAHLENPTTFNKIIGAFLKG
ncbi:MAG: alpha/beta fold hydrolase [Planktomarina sp.]